MDLGIPYIFGFQGIADVVDNLQNSLHSNLLYGDLVFAVRGGSELSQAVVVKNLARDSQGNFSYLPDDYSIGLITQGYTEYHPHVPKAFLETFFLKDLEKNKISKDIIKNFKEIINKL